MAKPLTVHELCANGDLLNQTREAGWVGFTVPAFVTAACYDAVVVGTARKLRTPTERNQEAARLRNFWMLCSKAVAEYRKGGQVLPVIRVQMHQAGTDRPIDVTIKTMQEANVVYLLVRLAKE